MQSADNNSVNVPGDAEGVPLPQLSERRPRTAREKVGRAAFVLAMVALTPLVAVLIVDALPTADSPRAMRCAGCPATRPSPRC